MSDLISRQAAIDALWKALYAYEDKTEKQFQESDELDVGDWIQHRIFVQNMSDIDRQTILALPPIQPEPCEDAVSREDAKWVVFCNRDHVEDQTNAIDDLPSAQLEIIRCRDCKHYDPYDSRKAFYCHEGIDGCYPDDFCSYAERRTDE